MSRFGFLLTSLAVVLSLNFVTPALAVPNFNNGFADWSGQLSGFDVIAADLSSDPHFSLNGNIAIISYADLMDPYWNFTLFQPMDADPLQGAGYQMTLSFYLRFIPGVDGTIDGHIISATLGADSLVDMADATVQSRLLAGDTFTADITNHAGSSSLLAFTLGDLDWSVTDSLLIGDFSFAQVPPAPVPEPSTILLLGAGLAGLVVCRKRTKG